jgi:hypothetical protein
MPSDSQTSESKITPEMLSLQHEMRKTRNLVGRATTLAGLGLILSCIILAVTLFGIDGLQENLQMLATATQEDYEDAAAVAADNTAITMNEAAKLADSLPQVPAGEWPTKGK